MKKNKYSGPERRKFMRLDFTAPLAYKICKKQTVSKILEGYTSNISTAGVLCNIKDKVKKNDVIWLSFDRNTLNMCESIESRSFIYQNGVFGKVARIETRKNKSFDVGVQFITREEKNLDYIYPKVHFLKNTVIRKKTEEEEDSAEAEPAEDKHEANEGRRIRLNEEFEEKEDIIGGNDANE